MCSMGRLCSLAFFKKILYFPDIILPVIGNLVRLMTTMLTFKSKIFMID